MNYLYQIKTAIIFFPFISLFFSLFYILYQYHKYGSINKIRTLIIYSFIFYLVVIYFLVILPLPDPSTLHKSDNMIRLIPFNQIIELVEKTPLKITDSNTYIKALTDPTFYTIIFNIFMMMSFGMYLRYYFKCSRKKTIVLTFLLSLFFELTQLTGLYFIYKYQYRIFDVDDLITNTLGGLLGYIIIGPLLSVLPSREEIDQTSYEQAIKVSGFRRLTIFLFDLFIYIFITTLLSIFIRKTYLSVVTFILLYILIPIITKGKTIASKFLNVKVEHSKQNNLFLILRIIIIFAYYIIMPLSILMMVFTYINKTTLQTEVKILILLIVFIIYLSFYIINILYLIIKNNMFYDTILKTKYINTIEESR